MSLGVFFRCLGKACVACGLEGLAGLVPGGALLYRIADKAWEDYGKYHQVEELREDVLAVAQAGVEEVREEVRRVVQEVAGDQPPERQQQLAAFLDQAPDA